VEEAIERVWSVVSDLLLVFAFLGGNGGKKLGFGLDLLARSLEGMDRICCFCR